MYQSSKSNISEHIKHILQEGELDENSVVRKYRTTASDGKMYNKKHYNLDMIIAIGYRIKSNIGVNFRKWATETLKEYMTKGFASSISSLFGCPPVTSFSQNVGLVNMTKVVNRFTIATGATAMILAGLLPPVGNFFASLPESVLGGCTLMMFGTILFSGVEMLAKAGFNQRNSIIVSLSLAIGIGFTTSSEIGLWAYFPEVIQSVFATNVVAVVFVVSILLNSILPKNMEVKSDQ